MSDGARSAVALGVTAGYVAVSLIIMWVFSVVSGYKGSKIDTEDKFLISFMWPILLPLVFVEAVWLVLVGPAGVLVRLVIDTCPRLRLLTLLFRPTELGQWLRNVRDRRLRNRTKEGGAE